jgi:hypothetical protein
MDKKYKVKLNSLDKVEELLQEIYDQACRQINEVQNEINKLTVSTNLGADDVTMEDKAKYSKAMHDFMGDKLKAIATKFEVAKFMGEMIKRGGDAAAIINDKTYAKKTSLNLDDIRNAISDDDTAVYDLK